MQELSEPPPAYARPVTLHFQMCQRIAAKSSASGVEFARYRRTVEKKSMAALAAYRPGRTTIRGRRGSVARETTRVGVSLKLISKRSQALSRKRPSVSEPK